MNMDLHMHVDPMRYKYTALSESGVPREKPPVCLRKHILSSLELRTKY